MQARGEDGRFPTSWASKLSAAFGVSATLQ
jgi:hypothetical protein